MVEICLNSDYKIQSDANQWILARKFKDSWKYIGYFSSLENLLSSFYDAELRASEAKSFDELLDISRNLKNSIQEALGRLNFQIEALYEAKQNGGN